MKVENLIRSLAAAYPQDDEIAVWIWDKNSINNILNLICHKKYTRGQLTEGKKVEILRKLKDNNDINMLMLNTLVEYIVLSFREQGVDLVGDDNIYPYEEGKIKIFSLDKCK